MTELSPTARYDTALYGKWHLGFFKEQYNSSLAVSGQAIAAGRHPPRAALPGGCAGKSGLPGLSVGGVEGDEAAEGGASSADGRGRLGLADQGRAGRFPDA